MSDKDNTDKNNERRLVDRRSSTLPDDFVNRRKEGERRKEDSDIDFPDRRKNQRRAPIVGVDFKDRRKSERRKNKLEKDSDS